MCGLIYLFNTRYNPGLKGSNGGGPSGPRGPKKRKVGKNKVYASGRLSIIFLELLCFFCFYNLHIYLFKEMYRSTV